MDTCRKGHAADSEGSVLDGKEWESPKLRQNTATSRRLHSATDVHLGPGAYGSPYVLLQMIVDPGLSCRIVYTFYSWSRRILQARPTRTRQSKGTDPLDGIERRDGSFSLLCICLNASEISPSRLQVLSSFNRDMVTQDRAVTDPTVRWGSFCGGSYKTFLGSPRSSCWTLCVRMCACVQVVKNTTAGARSWAVMHLQLIACQLGLMRCSHALQECVLR